MTNRFEFNQETYEIAYPTIPIGTRDPSPRKRLYLTADEMEIMQCAFSTYLEVSDPDSKEYKVIERFGYEFEDFKNQLRRK